ncbi:MAG: hypothetical protein ACI379_13275 [Nocardioides sp.]|uniref:hypothetical protein n=1 Tax=Nocardioides sp. TaxID=35761 RepID=UPI003F0782EC
MPTSLGRTRRVLTAGVVATITVLAAACSSPTSGGSDPDKPEAEPTETVTPQEAQQVWSVPAGVNQPQQTTARYWTSAHRFFQDEAVLGGELIIRDGRTGKEVTTALDDFVCAQTHLDPEDEMMVALVAPRGTAHLTMEGWGGQPLQSDGLLPSTCTQLVAVRLATGDVAWRRDLEQVDTIRGSSLDLHDDVLHVNGYEQPTRCFALSEGTPRPCGPSTPAVLLDELGQTMDDPVLDPLATARGVSVFVATTMDGAPQTGRVHDTATGEFLWDRYLEPDPEPEPGFYQGDLLAFDDHGMLRFSYAGEDRSVLVVTRIDERTGEDVGEVGRLEDVVFRGQVGGVTIVGGLRRGDFVPPLKGYRFDDCGRDCTGA